jgi:hypothetical protein
MNKPNSTEVLWQKKVYLDLQTSAPILYSIAFSNFHLVEFPPNIILKISISKAASR